MDSGWAWRAVIGERDDEWVKKKDRQKERLKCGERKVRGGRRQGRGGGGKDKGKKG